MLFSMRSNINEQNDKSALKSWLRQNGRDTVDKFLEFEASGFKKGKWMLIKNLFC